MKITTLSDFFYLYQKSENFPKEKAKKTELILVFLTILLSGTLINISAPLQFGITLIILILSLVLLINKSKIDRLVIQNTLFLLLVIILIFFGKYFGSEVHSIVTYGSYITNILIALLILVYFSNKPESLTKSIYIVLYFIMLHALLSLLAWYVIGNFLTYVPIVKTYTFGYIFYYVYTDSDVLNAIRTVEFFGFPFFRGSGIFWEPGILQIYMNILLFLSLYIYPNRRISVLSSVVIFTTWSSTGMVILVMQIFFYMLSKLSTKNALKTVALFGVIAMMLIPLQENLTHKLEGEDAGSGFTRALDTMTAINIIKNNPLFGIAIDSEVYKRELEQNRAFIDMAGSREERDAKNTNSILNYFVFFGIPIGILILYSLYHQNIFPRNKMPLFLLFVIAMSTEPIGFYVFPLMLIFSKYILKHQKRSFS